MSGLQRPRQGNEKDPSTPYTTVASDLDCILLKAQFGVFSWGLLGQPKLSPKPCQFPEWSLQALGRVLFGQQCLVHHGPLKL